MDKKQYNQMGFDFGDSNPEQDVPAAGFRIKQLKPASSAEAGEQEQENQSQEDKSVPSGVTTQSAPAGPQENGNAAAPVQPAAAPEAITNHQQSENDPHNDSEVILNTPVTSEAEAHNGTPAAEQVQEEQPQAAAPITEPPPAARQETQQEAPESEEAATVNKIMAEEKKEENTAPETPVQAEKPAEVKPNIPSRLTRPTQVYAVEDTEDTPPQKTDKNAIFTPASEDVTKTAPPEAAEPPVSYHPAPQEPVEEETEVYYQEAETEAAPEPEQPKKSTRGRKSLKSLEAEAGHVNIPDDSTLFKRQYYSIGEVAGMFAVNQSLLRFWENEFDVIQPRKNRKGDRHFRPVDIKNLELIYDLLRRRKLTIEGAKEFLKKNKQARERFEMIQSLQQIKGFLLEIKASL